MNNMLLIDNVAMPTPSEFKIGLSDLDSNEAGRSVDGNLHRDVIGMNFRKIELSWKTITRADLQNLLKAISKESFKVTYRDPIHDTMITKTMYCGDRSIDMYSYVIDNGQPLWTNISMNFIQLYNNNTEPDIVN